MSLLIRLDSTMVPTQTSHNFMIQYLRPIQINETWEMALIKTNLWYSWYNVSVEYNNNIIRYNNGALWRSNITIPNGQYTITQLNDYLHSIMKTNGDYTVVGGIDTFDINILPNFSTLHVDIVITNSYKLDLTLSDFNLLLGFTQIIVSSTQEGANVANINRDINSIQLHCNVAAGSYENTIDSNILYSFVPNSPPGSNIEVNPQPKLIYLPLRRRDIINEISIYFTDNLNRPLNLNGEPVSVLLHFRKAPTSYLRND